MAAKTTVLLVDDEEVFLQVKEGLESYDGAYAVDWAKDAGECLKYVGEKRPDLILLALKLPDMDGFALRERLKLTEAKDVPVIYLTAKYDLEMTKKVGMLTADDFIAKPISMPELILRIQKIMMWRCYSRPKKKSLTNSSSS